MQFYFAPPGAPRAPRGGGGGFAPRSAGGLGPRPARGRGGGPQKGQPRGGFGPRLAGPAGLAKGPGLHAKPYGPRAPAGENWGRIKQGRLPSGPNEGAFSQILGG